LKDISLLPAGVMAYNLMFGTKDTGIQVDTGAHTIFLNGVSIGGISAANSISIDISYKTQVDNAFGKSGYYNLLNGAKMTDISISTASATAAVSGTGTGGGTSAPITTYTACRNAGGDCDLPPCATGNQLGTCPDLVDGAGFVCCPASATPSGGTLVPMSMLNGYQVPTTLVIDIYGYARLFVGNAELQNTGTPTQTSCIIVVKNLEQLTSEQMVSFLKQVDINPADKIISTNEFMDYRAKVCK
jgi:hypothetical protein